MAASDLTASCPPQRYSTNGCVADCRCDTVLIVARQCTVAVEPTHAQTDPDHTPERWQVGRVPAITTVHGSAHRAAVRAAATAIHATGGDLKMGQNISRHLLNPASRDRPLNVHTLFNGEACRRHQSLVPSRHNPRKVRENRKTGTTSVYPVA